MAIDLMDGLSREKEEKGIRIARNKVVQSTMDG